MRTRHLLLTHVPRTKSERLLSNQFNDNVKLMNTHENKLHSLPFTYANVTHFYSKRKYTGEQIKHHLIFTLSIYVSMSKTTLTLYATAPKVMSGNFASFLGILQKPRHFFYYDGVKVTSISWEIWLSTYIPMYNIRAFHDFHSIHFGSQMMIV